MPVIQITGGSLKSRKITFPEIQTLRPTLSKTREAIFNMLASMFDVEEASFLDLFAGSGIMAFEAVSRGYQEVVCIEKHAGAWHALQQNIKSLSVDITPLRGDALKMPEKLEGMGKNFDVIFIDPPYQEGLYAEALEQITEFNILKPKGIIILEHPEKLLIDYQAYQIIKQKKYSDKLITMLSE